MEKGLDGEQVVGSSAVIDELLVYVSLKTTWKGGSATGKRYVSGPSGATAKGLMAFKSKVEAER